MLFINTRPQDRAEKLSHALRMAHVPVLDLPLLELVARPWSAALFELYQQLLAAQVIVVVSPTAVQLGMDYLKHAGISLDELQQQCRKSLRLAPWFHLPQSTGSAEAHQC